MADIIQLLPDSVANQIAAGEVIQRPASAVKELLENAIDAGATNIKLIVKDAGKTLLQVIDNGKGMSETDARMSFERHATSKIRKAEDLFSIKSFGFRGEALASIAAIAQVEMKTRKENSEIGTKILIEGTEIKQQEPCSTPVGTSIAVKNLFFNVPARRNFLKSDPVELRHIIEEFTRVAIPNNSIAFSFHHNNEELFHLQPTSLRQRIAGIFGNNYNERLVPVEENTNIINVNGFVGKPEHAKKTRGEQYFFINNRFIKSAYLHHAVQTAYKEILSDDSFPSYFILMEIDPKVIDINIHPTKTEIKFEDEKSIYMILRSAVKRSLGRFHLSPSLDFERETSFDVPVKATGPITAPEIKVNPNYNPFTQNNPREKSPTDKNNLENWNTLYSGFVKANTEIPATTDTHTQQVIAAQWDEVDEVTKERECFQLHNKYIVCAIKSGLVILDQQAAHERILFERFIKHSNSNKEASQQLLFPETIEFSSQDFELIKELFFEINALGFDISEFGKNTFVVNGVPALIEQYAAKEMIEKIIQGFKENLQELKTNKYENLCRSMAKTMAVKAGKKLSTSEMNTLIDELFACEMPYTNPAGKPTLTAIQQDELDKRFKK